MNRLPFDEGARQELDVLTGRVIRLEAEQQRLQTEQSRITSDQQKMAHALEMLRDGSVAMTQQFAKMQEQSERQVTMLQGVLDAIGASPDDATGADGNGMRGQVAMLVEAHERESARREKNGKRLAVFGLVTAAIVSVLEIWKYLRGYWVIK